MTNNPEITPTSAIKLPAIVAPIASKEAKTDGKPAKTPKARDNGGNGSLEDKTNGEEVGRGVGKIDIAEAFDLRFKDHKTFEEIGKHFGVTNQAVSKCLQVFTDLFSKQAEMHVYRDNRADAITYAEMVALKTTVGKLPDANAYQAGSIWKKIYDAGRLERDLSTSNIFMVNPTIEELAALDRGSEAYNEERGNDAKKEELEAIKANTEDYE